MEDVASEAGCSVSTVSRALRSDRRISQSVRERVGAAAERLGYRWDPAVSRLMADFRRRSGGGDSRETIALVHTRARPYRRDDPLGFWSALVEAGTSLGLRVEEFPLDRDNLGTSGRTVSRILHHRGIRGLLLFPFYQPDIRAWNLDWDAFAMVAVGSSPDAPNIDRVDLSDYEDALMCLGKMTSRGYRRIGLTSSEDSERHTGGIFVAAYRYFCEIHPEVEPVPVLRLTGRNRGGMLPEDRSTFESWFIRHRPETILTSHHDIREWLAAMGRSVPEDVGLATLWPHEGWAGIDHDSSQLMRPALEHLTGKLHGNALGLSPTPRRLLVRSPWREGETLKRKQKS